MPFGNTIQALLKLARVALASLLLVGVPMADAFACAGETSSTSIVAEEMAINSVATTAVDDAGHEGQAGGDAQHCIHGHCHHGAAFRGDVETANTFATVSVGVKPHGTAVVLSRVPGGLERPPKA